MGNRNIVLIAFVSMLLLQGCSKVLLPYHECVECDVGKGDGYCGSVSDVYEYLNKDKGYR